ncbi:MAG: hypothetical protein ACRDRW_18955, partial [Pseudonocardiaceae bacterium]
MRWWAVTRRCRVWKPGPGLIPESHAIQSRLGWLPREELVALARRMRRPLYEIESLVSCYPHFRTQAPPPPPPEPRTPTPLPAFSGLSGVWR